MARSIRTWSAGLDHVAARIVPGNDHAMAMYFQVRKDVQAFIRRVLAKKPSASGKAPKTGKPRA